MLIIIYEKDDHFFHFHKIVFEKIIGKINHEHVVRRTWANGRWWCPRHGWETPRFHRMTAILGGSTVKRRFSVQDSQGISVFPQMLFITSFSFSKIFATVLVRRYAYLICPVFFRCLNCFGFWIFLFLVNFFIVWSKFIFFWIFCTRGI